MQSLPDLSQLSHAQKDELIIALFGQEQELMKRIDGMQKAIDDLQGRLSLNSKNSSKPPSSDDLNKPKPKSLRVGGQRPTGGQKGHPGGTLRQVPSPIRSSRTTYPINAKRASSAWELRMWAKSAKSLTCPR